MRFRAVFFDAGETLVHPTPSFPELFASIVGERGYRVESDAVVAAARVVVHRFNEAARHNDLWTTSPDRSRAFWAGVYDAMLAELRLPTGDGLRDALHHGFTDRSNYGLFDDVRPTLDALRGGGLTLGIVSNFERWLEDLLVELGVHDAFAVRVISGVEGLEKPDPRIYELGLRRAGVDAGEAVFVGDNPEFDVEPPAALGMFAVLLDRRGRHPDHSGARITGLLGLPELIVTRASRP
jgi:FMN phosphatase YigB (HAD superfamily)